MKFGVFYVLECPDGNYRRAWQEMLEQIEYAERLGFDSVWLAEHHGSTYGSMPSPQVAAAAIAARTRRMRIGIAVSILPFDNPVRIAEDYAMVDVISDGRLDFGVGRGYQPHEFKMLGLADRQAHSREIFREALDVILGSWSHETFSYRGKHFQFEDIQIVPRPVQSPHPPVYMAAISPESFELVKEKGLKIMVTPTLMSLNELKQHVLDAKRELVKLGHEPETLNFPMNWQMHISDSPEKAKAETAEAFGWYFAKVMSLVPQGASTPPSYERYAELADAFATQGTVDLDGLREQGIVLLDTPERAVAAIRELWQEIGQQEIFCWMRIGGLEHEKVMRSLTLFAEQVMPHVKPLEPNVPRALRAG
jgi:alkanesulfonate monooxygenase SsuD/methylene tetrahydromethanopterin reductase-like flavin-dependent oxidoreductase (luciferase family)